MLVGNARRGLCSCVEVTEGSTLGVMPSRSGWMHRVPSPGGSVQGAPWFCNAEPLVGTRRRTGPNLLNGVGDEELAKNGLKSPIHLIVLDFPIFHFPRKDTFEPALDQIKFGKFKKHAKRLVSVSSQTVHWLAARLDPANRLSAPSNLIPHLP